MEDKIRPEQFKEVDGNQKTPEETEETAKKIEHLLKEKRQFDEDLKKGLESPRLTATGHRHKEAFCLMNYQCEKCYAVEVVWNSRDGVTPFIIGCQRCDGSMQHINWDADRYDPDHFPIKGERVFITMTKEISELIWKVFIRKNWEVGQHPVKDSFNSKRQALQELMSFDPEKGEPYLLKI